MPTQVQNANATHAFNVGGSGTVVTVSATTPGNLIVVAFEYNAYSGTFTISDSSGGSNTWVVASPTNANSQNPPCAFDSNFGGSFVAWTFSTASITTVTLTATSAYYVADGTVSEWSGLSAYQSSASAFNDAGAAPITPGAVTLATSSDVVIGVIYPQFDSTAAPNAPLAKFSSDSTGYTVYAQPGSAGSFTPSWANPNGRNWVAAAAAFTVPAGAGPVLGKQDPPNFPVYVVTNSGWRNGHNW